MNDLERRLKDTLEADASKAPTVQRAPDRLRPKVRRRQLGTALVGSLTALALIAASVAGFRTLDRTDPTEPLPADEPWAGYQVFERTASLHVFTISSASDWYLVNPSIDPECTANLDCEFHEVLQLSNYDPGLTRSACAAPVPAGGVVLVIRLDLLHTDDAESYPAFPVAFDPETPFTDGPCGRGRYIRFQAGFPYTAWIGTGDGASEEDVDALIRSFDGMESLPPTREAPGGDSSRAAYVIAGGENAAGSWRLDARPSPPGAPSSNVELALVGPVGGSIIEGFSVPAVPIEQAGGDPTFGAVAKAADSVELRTDGIVEPAQVVPLPPTLASDFDLFFGSHEGDVRADAVALDRDGRALGGSYVLPPIDVTPDGNHVIARFDAFGAAWELSAPRSGETCDLRLIPNKGRGGGSCEVSIASGEDYAFAYGTLPDGAATAHVVTADGRELPCAVLTAGPAGNRYFVVLLVGKGPGELQFLRTDGSVLLQNEIAWQQPEIAIGPPVASS